MKEENYSHDQMTNQYLSQLYAPYVVLCYGCSLRGSGAGLYGCGSQSNIPSEPHENKTKRLSRMFPYTLLALGIESLKSQDSKRHGNGTVAVVISLFVSMSLVLVEAVVVVSLLVTYHAS